MAKQFRRTMEHVLEYHAVEQSFRVLISNFSNHHIQDTKKLLLLESKFKKNYISVKIKQNEHR